MKRMMFFLVLMGVLLGCLANGLLAAAAGEDVEASDAQVSALYNEAEDLSGKIADLKLLIEAQKIKRGVVLRENALRAQAYEYANEDISFQKQADRLAAEVEILGLKLKAVRQQHELTQQQVDMENELNLLKKQIKEMKSIRINLLFNGGILTGKSRTGYYYYYNDSYYEESYSVSEPEAWAELCVRAGFNKGLAPFSIGALLGGNAKKEAYAGLGVYVPLVKSDAGTSAVYLEGGGVYYFRTVPEAKREPDKITAFPWVGLSLETKNLPLGFRFMFQVMPGDVCPIRVAGGVVF